MLIFISVDQIQTTWEMSRVSHKMLSKVANKGWGLDSVLSPMSKGTVQGQAGTAPLLVIPQAGSSLGGGKSAWLAEPILRKGFWLFHADKCFVDGRKLGHGNLSVVSEMFATHDESVPSFGGLKLIFTFNAFILLL